MESYTINFFNFNNLCRFIHTYLRFIKRRLLPNTCKKQWLEKHTGLVYRDSVKLIEQKVKGSQKTTCEFDTRFVDMGGANNLGMLCHHLIGDVEPLFATKLESCRLAEREYFFLKWQQETQIEEEWVAADIVCCTHLGSSDICGLTMEYLHTPKVHDDQGVIDLYRRMGKLTKYLSSMPNAIQHENLIEIPLEANTKITRTIKYIVTQLHHPDAYQVAKEFMEKRKSVFSGWEREYQKIVQFISDSAFLSEDFNFDQHYGLLHGDFKKDNILSDCKGRLKVIDLQYYSYGARLWDMAFLCSKEKEWFGGIHNKFIRPLALSPTEYRIFVLLFVLADLLHVRKSNVKRKLTMHVLPALSSVATYGE